MENLNLRGGALIIGSLFWQDDLCIEKKDGIRKNWRDNYLVDEEIKMRLPIRYGRLSKGGIFTMVFSKECEREASYGTAYIKAFKNGQINNWEELERQAIKMSKAEGMKGRFIGGSSDIWGTMSILFNPDIDTDKRDYLIGKWSNRVKKDGGGNDLEDYKFGNEESAIKSDCSLNFDWFEPVNNVDRKKLDVIDFVICTVTKPRNPETNDYPTIPEQVSAVEKDKKRKYFKNNVENGISTFEDDLIKAEIKKIKSATNKV